MDSALQTIAPGGVLTPSANVSKTTPLPSPARPANSLPLFVTRQRDWFAAITQSKTSTTVSSRDVLRAVSASNADRMDAADFAVNANPIKTATPAASAKQVRAVSPVVPIRIVAPMDAAERAVLVRMAKTVVPPVFAYHQIALPTV